ncbi:endospore germination permease [Bacillus salitolerans]|uniref:Endospore germination permease n=1 Tax=Bacillus salitolerans TaxID=1437434 RepID=A0ABW4LMU4_9BACI
MTKQKENISPRQFAILVALFTIGSAILFLPATLTGIAEQDGWISALLATTIGIGFVLFFAKVGTTLKNMTFIEACQYALGKKIGGILAAFYLTFPFLLCTFLLWDIGDFMVTQIIVETPIQAVFILFILTIVYTVRSGIESVARTAEIFVPWVYGLFFIIIIFVIPSIQITNLLPILENGIRPVLLGSYHMMSFPILELSLFLMVTKNIYDPSKIKSAFLNGFFRGTFVLFIVTMACIYVLGPDFTARNAFPVYILGKKVAIGEFLQRIEIVIAIMWFLSILFKLAIAFYSLVLGTSQILGLKDYRPLTLPYAVLLVISTIIMIPNSIFLTEFDQKAQGPYIFFICVIIPLIVFIALMRKERLNKKDKKEVDQHTST